MSKVDNSINGLKLLWAACDVLYIMLKGVSRLDRKSAYHKGWMVQENVRQQIKKASGTHPASDM